MKRLGELAEFLGCRLVGDPNLPIEDAKTTLRAGRHDLTFATCDQHLQLFLHSPSLAAIVGLELDAATMAAETNKSFLQVEQVEPAFVRLVPLFRAKVPAKQPDVSQQAFVSPQARISPDVQIYPGAFVGDNVQIGCGSILYPQVTLLDNVIIGEQTILFPNVVVYENSIIGNRCLIHSGTVIGGYGFGYRSSERHELSPQLGNVMIGDDVEIGSNATIDRGTYDSTTIGDGTKIDNLVMIGHNCQIGKHNLLCAQVGIAGSTITGDYVVMAGQVGVGDHLKIGQRSTIAAQSGVMHDLDGDQVYLGAPAIPGRRQMQIHSVINMLPEMRQQLRELQREVEALQKSMPPRQHAA